MADGLITQVSYPQDISDIDTSVSNEDPLPSTLKFELRGKQFVIARETLVMDSSDLRQSTTGRIVSNLHESMFRFNPCFYFL
jgi:hypothetical protein